MRKLKLVIAVLLSGGLLLSCGKAPKIDASYPLTRLTERVYVIHGPNEMPNKANQGFMNNPGFVLTAKGIVVIDPGSSLQVGEMLLAKIATVSKEPVVAVFNTHLHGDHWLANDAIRRAYPKAVIYAHPKMLESAAAAGESWLRLMLQLTDGATKGTQAVIPNLGIDNEETLAIGGMHFRIHHQGVAHTGSDIMIEVVEDKVLFGGDNILVARAGRMDDGNFKGNIAACDMALKTGARIIVPGHGPSGGPELIRTYRDYLRILYGSVKKYADQGLGDFEMKDKVVADLKPYQQWAMFDSEIGKLISLAYLQAEQEAF